MKSITRKLLSLLTLSFVTLATPAWALSLNEAQANGLVGETPNGYLASVSSAPNSDTRRLISEINTKRKAAYQDIATKAGVTLNIIEIRIGQRLYDSAPKGAFLQNQQGHWTQKQ